MQTLLQWSITENPSRLVYYIALYQIQSVKNPWNLQFLQNTVAFPYKRCTSENISQLCSTDSVRHWKIKMPKKDLKRPTVSCTKEGICDCGTLKQKFKDIQESQNKDSVVTAPELPHVRPLKGPPSWNFDITSDLIGFSILFQFFSL